MSKIAVVRVKGSVNVREEVKETLRMLNLTRPNYCVLLDDEPSRKGMLQKAKELVTWGAIKPEVLEEILVKRGEFKGGDPVTDEKIDEITSYKTVGEFSEAVCSGDAALKDLDGLREVFRLHPPKKGFKTTRRSFQHGGALGERGEKINDLLLRMI